MLLTILLALIMVFSLSFKAWTAAYTLKLGHANDPDPENSIFHAVCLDFQKRVHEYSKGEIEVQIYPAGQLGGEQESVRSCQIGSQEASLISMSNLNVFAKSLGFYTLPYMFGSIGEARYVVDTMWDQVNKWSVAEAGVRILTVTDAGFRVLSNAKKPVTKLDDLKGLKIRVPNNPIMLSAFKSFGVDPIPMGWPIFTQLQQKVIDGQENPVNVLLAVKFYEVQKYVTDIDWIFQGGALILSESFFKSLPQELKDAVVKAGKETMMWERNYVEEVTAKDIARLKELGIVFSGPPTDKEEWMKRARGTWDANYEGIGNGDAAKGKAIVEQVKKVAAEYKP
jgi:tripartite ATP-independent transporter DctP family solute receptor